MKIIEVEGIIISDTNYSETSKILNVLTKEYGKIGILSKGCRSLKSKLRGVSSKLIYGKFNIYYKENGLSTLIEVDVINPFKNIIQDIEKISYASYILELVDQVIKQTDNTDIYDLLIQTLEKVNEGYNPGILTNIIELKALEFLGVRPIIDCCSICGNQTDIVTLNPTLGGFICKNCYNNERIYSDKTIKLVRMFYYVDISKITKLEISEEAKKEINEFIEEYYSLYTGLYLKSKKFLKNLNKIG